ncbi:MAG: ABC transporter permease [Planctomycetes bacterium]|nr:ABC transporter permease [Planctomycetota bacterium]
MVHTARKITGEKVLYSERHLDIFIAASALLILLAAAIFYSWISCRRLAKSSGHAKRESQGLWAVAWRQFKKNRLATTGASILIALYLIAIFCPLITAYDPTEQGHLVKERLLKPSLDHLLGTDRFSRDVFSRILHGSRISLLVGFLAVGISITIGTVYGAVAGYFGRWIDSILMRFVDMMLSFPTLILIITIVAISKSQSIWLIIAVIGLTSWMGVARLVRGEILLLKELDFFQASRALGAGAFRLIFRHLLPNAMTPIIVAATLRVGSTILLEASLSYLGLGVQPPTPSWGNIIYDTKENIFTEWWMPLSAGLAITITVVGYNLLGDGLRDALDPKMRR